MAESEAYLLLPLRYSLCCMTPAGGKFFNLFGLGKSEAELKDLKTKELKNGRLAMLAVFGFGGQVGCD